MSLTAQHNPTFVILLHFSLLSLLGLVNPKSAISQYDTRNAKEVLSPLQVAEHNYVGADPHYCSLTSNLQVTPILDLCSLPYIVITPSSELSLLCFAGLNTTMALILSVPVQSAGTHVSR